MLHAAAPHAAQPRQALAPITTQPMTAATTVPPPSWHADQARALAGLVTQLQRAKGMQAVDGAVKAAAVQGQGLVALPPPPQ